MVFCVYMWLLAKSSHCKWLYLGTGGPNQPFFNGRSHEKRGVPGRSLVHQPKHFRFFGSALPPWLFTAWNWGESGWGSTIKKKHDWTPVFFIQYRLFIYGLLIEYGDSLFITDGIVSWDYWSSTILLIYQGSPWCFTNTNIITDLSILHSPGPNKSFRICRPVDQALGQSFDEKEEQWPAVPAVVPGVFVERYWLLLNFHVLPI